jgi:hypothetical protein
VWLTVSRRRTYAGAILRCFIAWSIARTWDCVRRPTGLSSITYQTAQEQGEAIGIAEIFHINKPNRATGSFIGSKTKSEKIEDNLKGHQYRNRCH